MPPHVLRLLEISKEIDSILDTHPLTEAMASACCVIYNAVEGSALAEFNEDGTVWDDSINIEFDADVETVPSTVPSR